MARMLVDCQLNLRWANSTALAWLKRKDCVSVRSGQLFVAGSQSDLKSIIAGANGQASRFCVPIERTAAHLFMYAKRLDLQGDNLLYGLTAQRTDEVDRSELFGVTEAFRLTPTEFETLKLLASGMAAQAIAERQNVAIETVRTHIRRLHTKLDVSGREQLFERLRPFLLADCWSR